MAASPNKKDDETTTGRLQFGLPRQRSIRGLRQRNRMTVGTSEKILNGASELFAKHGYFGTSTREIASEAGVTEPSIYRLFLNKEKLFHECLDMALERSLDPAQFLLLISGEEEAGDFAESASRAVRHWYSSLPTQSARLLMQAALTDNTDWKRMAYSRMDRIINILARQIEKELRLSKVTAGVAARTLILALFQFKVARTMLSTSEKERDAVDLTIAQWLNGLKEV